jgi:hypothetical protein
MIGVKKGAHMLPKKTAAAAKTDRWAGFDISTVTGGDQGYNSRASAPATKAPPPIIDDRTRQKVGNLVWCDVVCLILWFVHACLFKHTHIHTFLQGLIHGIGRFLSELMNITDIYTYIHMCRG